MDPEQRQVYNAELDAALAVSQHMDAYMGRGALLQPAEQR